MNIEIERKFYLGNYNLDDLKINYDEKRVINQTYISITEQTETRLREYEEKGTYEIGMKTVNNIEKLEWDSIIDKEFYNKLIKSKVTPTLRKNRYYFTSDERFKDYYLDVFIKGNNKVMIVLEVEFEDRIRYEDYNESELRSFLKEKTNLEDQVIVDVSNNSYFKNSNLANILGR